MKGFYVKYNPIKTYPNQDFKTSTLNNTSNG